MDAVIFGVIAVVFTYLTIYGTEQKEPSSVVDTTVPEDISRTTKLNDNFYEDPDAFTEISKALGFPRKR